MTVDLRGGISIVGETNDAQMSKIISLPGSQLSQMVTNCNQIVFVPRYPSSLTQTIYKKYDLNSKKNPRQIYSQHSQRMNRLNTLDDSVFPPIIGRYDQLWRRFAGIQAGLKVLGYQNINHIFGVSSGANTALLLLRYAKELGLNLPNLQSVNAMAGPLDFAATYQARDTYFQQLYASFIPTTDQDFVARSVDIFDLAKEYPSVRFNLFQGGQDQSVLPGKFLDLQNQHQNMDRELDNLNFVYIPEAGHDLRYSINLLD